MASALGQIFVIIEIGNDSIVSSWDGFNNWIVNDSLSVPELVGSLQLNKSKTAMR